MRVYHDFFWYPDPDQSFLMRIRIQANDTDPTGSGSETLKGGIKELKCPSYEYLRIKGFLKIQERKWDFLKTKNSTK